MTCPRCGQEHTAGPWCEQAPVPGGPGAMPPLMVSTPAVPLNGPPAPAEILPPSARGKHFPVPYLGPEPAPSRGLGMGVRVTAALLTVVSVGQAALLFRRNGLDHEMAAGATVATEAALRANTGLLALSTVIRVGLFITVIVLEIVWHRSRRPKDRRELYGEAHVELPMKWVIPGWLRAWPGVLIPLSILAGIASGVVAQPSQSGFFPPTVREIYESRALSDQWGIAGSIGWAVVWALFALWPAYAERSHEIRVAWSQWYRERGGSVPYVPPVKDTNPGEIQPIRVGWVLRTTGLVVLAMFGLVATPSALALIGDDPTGGGVWLMVALCADAVVVMAIVRRFKGRDAVPAGPSGKVEWF